MDRDETSKVEVITGRNKEGTGKLGTIALDPQTNFHFASIPVSYNRNRCRISPLLRLFLGPHTYLADTPEISVISQKSISLLLPAVLLEQSYSFASPLHECPCDFGKTILNGFAGAPLCSPIHFTAQAALTAVVEACASIQTCSATSTQDSIQSAASID